MYTNPVFIFNLTMTNFCAAVQPATSSPAALRTEPGPGPVPGYIAATRTLASQQSKAGEAMPSSGPVLGGYSLPGLVQPGLASLASLAQPGLLSLVQPGLSSLAQPRLSSLASLGPPGLTSLASLAQPNITSFGHLGLMGQAGLRGPVHPILGHPSQPSLQPPWSHPGPLLPYRPPAFPAPAPAPAPTNILSLNSGRPPSSQL